MEGSLVEATRSIVPGVRVERLEINQWQVMFLAAIGLAIVVCEYVFAYHNVAFGIAIALAMVILIYITLSYFNLEQRMVNTAESMALIPLYILFTSSLPWFFINQQYLLPAVYSCILGLVFWHIYQNKLNLKQILGFSKKHVLKYCLIGLAIGTMSGTVEYLILHPAATFPTFEVRYLFRDMVYMLLFVGLGEELLFRGLIQRDLTNIFGWKWGLVGASFLFAIMHLTWRSIPELVFVFFAGLIMGFIYWKTKSLLAPIVLHCVNNTMLVAVVPYILG
ncbi:lysostaphin resistance A-like protein [Chloroflexota bacterium]